ncbi:hypothetical protein EJ063_05870 [Vibrio aquaticus]|uniref:Uncharacterized protein n=2 Tax=Vibrio aquaticus TaxID=2496559 RepID=A0A3S0P9L9_9VIBR|nr:hypothetical protein EJ063_05870 [Vibrio aquaticus]
MNRILLIAVLTLTLGGCVLYPTTRDYYKPVAEQDQTPAASMGCGYHKAKHDGLQQQYDGHTIHVYPSRDNENGITVVAVLESDNEESKLVHAEVVTESGALMTAPSEMRLTSEYYDSDTGYRSWYEAKYPPIKVTPEQLTILVTDEQGKTLEFHFEHTIQSDIFYSSINC